MFKLAYRLAVICWWVWLCFAFILSYQANSWKHPEGRSGFVFIGTVITMFLVTVFTLVATQAASRNDAGLVHPQFATYRWALIGILPCVLSILTVTLAWGSNVSMQSRAAGVALALIYYGATMFVRIDTANKIYIGRERLSDGPVK